MNLVRMFVLMKSRTCLKLGHVRSKTRSLAQILEEPCVCSRGHIFSLIIMILDENVCLDEISYRMSLKMGHIGSRTRSLVKSKKNLVYVLEATVCPIIMKLGQNVFLGEISDKFENGSCRLKT